MKRHPESIVSGALDLLRRSWRNDGAEGETIHLLCDALETAIEDRRLATDLLKAATHMLMVCPADRDVTPEYAEAVSAFLAARSALCGVTDKPLSEHQQRVRTAVREMGGCGSVDRDGLFVCIKPIGHDPPCFPGSEVPE